MADPRKNATIEIREMDLADLQAVYRLGEKLFTTDWPNLYRTWDEFELVEFYAADEGTCFVAVATEEELVGEEVVGFVLGTILSKRAQSSWRYGWVVWLGVDPELSGLGIGNRLIERLTDTFIDEGVRILLVDTDAKNQPAISFFQRRGFGNANEHVFMTKNLTKFPKYAKRIEELRHEGGTKPPSDMPPPPKKRAKGRATDAGQVGDPPPPRRRRKRSKATASRS